METFSLNWNNSREERSYLAKGWSTDNCLNKCKTPIFINYIDPTRPAKMVSLSLKIVWVCVNQFKSLQILSPTISWSVFLMEKMFVGLSCSWKMFKLITNRIKQKYPEKSRTISKKSRDENIRLSRPKKSRDPGIGVESRPVPSRNEIPRKAGHCCWVVVAIFDFWFLSFDFRFLILIVTIITDLAWFVQQELILRGRCHFLFNFYFYFYFLFFILIIIFIIFLFYLYFYF